MYSIGTEQLAPRVEGAINALRRLALHAIRSKKPEDVTVTCVYPIGNPPIGDAPITDVHVVIEVQEPETTTKAQLDCFVTCELSNPTGNNSTPLLKRKVMVLGPIHNEVPLGPDPNHTLKKFVALSMQISAQSSHALHT